MTNSVNAAKFTGPMLRSAAGRLLVASVFGVCAYIVATGRPAARSEASANSRWMWTQRSPQAPVSATHPSGAHAAWVPFIDTDNDQAYDPFVDMVGYCGPAGCTVPDFAVEIQRTLIVDEHGQPKSGILIVARNARARASATTSNSTKICTSAGACSEERDNLFPEHPGNLDALWLCTSSDSPQTPLTDTLLVADGGYAPLPPRPMQRVEVEAGASPQPTAHSPLVHVTTSIPFDRVSARIVRMLDGRVDATLWTSALLPDETQPGNISRVSDNHAIITMPDKSVLRCPSCTLALVVQAEHWWRSDWVSDRSVGVKSWPLPLD